MANKGKSLGVLALMFFGIIVPMNITSHGNVVVNYRMYDLVQNKETSLHFVYMKLRF